MYDLQYRLQQSKDNVEMIQKLMNGWCRSPLFERIEGKHSTLLNLADREDRLRRRYDDITQAGLKIHQLMQVSSEYSSPDCIFSPNVEIHTNRICCFSLSINSTYCETKIMVYMQVATSCHVIMRSRFSRRSQLVVFILCELTHFYLNFEFSIAEFAFRSLFLPVICSSSLENVATELIWLTEAQTNHCRLKKPNRIQLDLYPRWSRFAMK